MKIRKIIFYANLEENSRKYFLCVSEKKDENKKLLDIVDHKSF
jgi:hypothetical protein